MTDASRMKPYARAAYLATVPAAHRETAEFLCDALEAAFDRKLLVIYSGIVVAIRDGEWMAGFAMRAKAPMIYICNEPGRAAMGPKAKALMAGKGCMELRAKGDVTLEDAMAMVKRGFKEASKHAGSISKAGAKARERERSRATATKASAAKASTPNGKSTAVRKRRPTKARG